MRKPWQMPLILALQEDDWWQDVTLPMLEQVRKNLRLLIKLIEKQQRKPVYTAAHNIFKKNVVLLDSCFRFNITYVLVSWS